MNTLADLGKNRKLLSKQSSKHFTNPSWLFNGKKIRINILGMGDVGASMLMGLKLLGGGLISEIGICDLNENTLKRLEMELNQTAYAWEYDKLPEIKIIDNENLFDCDIFVFCATKGIAPVGTYVTDVRMAQLEANKTLISDYACVARANNFKGMFAVVSDPIEPLCRAAWYASNCNYLGEFDDAGLHPEQIQGFGLGVMNARAAYYAKRDSRFASFLKDGRVFGQHGEGLIVADSIEKYNHSLSVELTNMVIEANLKVREVGFKPFIAPALSSAAIPIIQSIKGEYHYSSVCLNEIYFGCKNRYTKAGREIEYLQLPDDLFNEIQKSYSKLEELA